MLYEFALTPDVFDLAVIGEDPALGVTLIQLLRGICDNGLIANLHKDYWQRCVKNRIERLSPNVKDKIIACFEILDARHRFVRHPRKETGDPTSDIDWLDTALESHSRIPFHGIVLGQALLAHCERNDAAFIELSEALDSPQWQNRRRSLTLNKREADYRMMLAPLLRHARALTLVDPYLNSHESRFLKTVQICSELMGQRGRARLQGRIHIHAEMKHQKPDGCSLGDYLGAWEKKLRPWRKKDGHHFKVFLWESLPSETLHDRFMLTDQCGVSVPGGLDCRTESANDTVWSLLDEEDRRKWLEKVTPGISPYKLLGEPREVL